MPPRKIQFVQGAYYHIYNRGANRQSIFRSDENYKFCLRLMQQYRQALNISVIAYCLMPNHYHWLVRQDGEETAGLLPTRVFNSYSKAFNNAYKRSGTLFEDRFDAILVETDEYLHHLCRYIHMNPVKDGFAAAPELWPYSNYPEWIGLRNGLLIDQVFVHAHFPDPQRYQAFVLDYLNGRSTLPKGLQLYLENL